MPFTVHSEIEYLNTRVMYESDCDKAELQSARNMVIGCERSKAPVTVDPYNSPKADIYKDIFGPRGSFILVIDAQREDYSENEETVLGRS